MEKKKRRVRCVGCEELFNRDDIEYGPDPYDEDVGGDDTPVWECDDCRTQSAMDI